MRALALMAVSLVWCASATAECWRLEDPPRAPDQPPDFDGRGAFGPLHETLTLECLTYLGRLRRGEADLALLRDEQGRLYPVHLHDYVGEDSGQVVALHDDFLVVRQFIKEAQSGQWQGQEVRLWRALEGLPQMESAPADSIMRP